jgi:NADH dehydrogenase [ubiquinone] 1 alpha subcomplex assembly factor 7
MTPLEIRIRARIAESGPIPVAEYMAIALGDPEHGYYRTRDPLGADGDFVTSPEISQVFGELIGLWCAVTWRAMGAPDPVRLIELGPGRGTLMADALRAVRGVPDFLAAADIHLVETSPELRRRQREALTNTRPTWHDRVSDAPVGPCLIIANEFFDALPVEQFVRTPDGWRQRCVGLDAATDGLCFVLTGKQGQVPARIANAPVGMPCETRPDGEELAREIAGRIVSDGGAALIIDYGHAASAAGDTLQAVRRHRFDDVLARPGVADLTAHVDFEALAAAARETGAAVHGPVAQGMFLERLGLGARMEKLCDGAPDRAPDIRGRCRRLVDPEQMGTLFKVFAIVQPGSPPPAGFGAEGALSS